MGSGRSSVWLTDDAVIVAIHEVGPRHVREDTEHSRAAWYAWQQRLQPPSLSDEAGTMHRLAGRRRAVGARGSPSTEPTPMKATVLPPARPEIRRWTIDGRWTVERPGG